MKTRENDRLRKKIYIIIFRSDTPAGKLFDVILVVFILLSILSVFLESIAAFRAEYGTRPKCGFSIHTNTDKYCAHCGENIGLKSLVNASNVPGQALKKVVKNIFLPLQHLLIIRITCFFPVIQGNLSGKLMPVVHVKPDNYAEKVTYSF